MVLGQQKLQKSFAYSGSGCIAREKPRQSVDSICGWQSYQHMGMAQVECEEGCTCDKREYSFTLP